MSRRKPFETREQWLMAAVKLLTPDFAAIGHTVPEVRVSVGWPGGRGKKNGVRGQCWSPSAATDKVQQIFISPALVEPIRVLTTLTHELCHAIDKCEHGHKKEFVAIAKPIGCMAGKAISSEATPELAARLAKIVAAIGDYPHAELRDGMGKPGEKPQKGRQLLCECDLCEYKCRASRMQIDRLGTPICPGCKNPTIEK